MSPVVDGGYAEAVKHIDDDHDDQIGQARAAHLAKNRAIARKEREQRPNQAEDGSGGAGRQTIRERVTGQRAGQARQQINHQEAPRPVEHLHFRADDIERIQVECQVQQTDVQEVRGEETPILARSHQRADVGAEVDEYLLGLAPARQRLDHKHDDEDAHHHVSYSRAVKRQAQSNRLRRRRRRLNLIHSRTIRGCTRQCSARTIPITSFTASSSRLAGFTTT